MADQVNNYHEGSLSFVQQITEQDVLKGKRLSAEQVGNLCSDSLTSAIYANAVAGSANFKKAKDKACEIAAQVVVKQGKEIEKQLQENDRAAQLGAQNTPEISQGGNQEQVTTSQNQPNTSEDVGRISGGTMAQIIAKISEIMAAMNPEERKEAAENVSALFSVLDNSFEKMPETMSVLAENPVVVANMQDMLQGTKGGAIFDNLIQQHLNPDQMQQVNEVSKEDLAEYRQEVTEQQSSHSR